MKVMAATDGSQRSLLALPHAARLAAALGLPLVLVRIIDPRSDAAGEVEVKLDLAVETVSARWQAELEDILRSAGIEGEGAVVAKRRAERMEEALLRAASDLGAGLVALESGRAGAIRHAVLGSVAMDVIKRSSLPVMVTHRPAPPSTDDNVYRLLTTNDGSPASRDVLVALGPLLAGKQVEVTLLRVLEPKVGDTDEAAETAAARLELEAELPLVPVAGEVNIVVRPLTGGRRVEAEILEVAEEIQADAIAMSTHGHSALRHLLAGSIALAVLKDSPIPVVLARGEG